MDEMRNLPKALLITDMQKAQSYPLVKLQASIEAQESFLKVVQYHGKVLFGLNDSFSKSHISELWAFISKEFPRARIKEVDTALRGYASGKYLPKSDYRTINGVFLGRLMKDYYENVQTPQRKQKAQEKPQKQLSEQQKEQIEYEFLNQCLIKQNFKVKQYCAYDVWKSLRNCGIEIKVTKAEQEKAAIILEEIKKSKKLIGKSYKDSRKELWNIGCMIAVNRFFLYNCIVEMGQKIDSYYNN